MNCKFCHKECKNKLSLSKHQQMCKLNPSKIESSWVAFNKSSVPKLNGYSKAKLEGRPASFLTIERR